MGGEKGRPIVTLRWTKHPFTIITDHANLQYWKSPRNLNRRTAQWHADLQEYDYEILYIPSKTNIPPDALSRLPGANKGEMDNQGIELLDPKRFTIATITPEGKIHVLAITEVKHGIMTLVHNHPTAGHLGRDETICKTKEQYWWPNIRPMDSRLCQRVHDLPAKQKSYAPEENTDLLHTI